MFRRVQAIPWHGLKGKIRLNPSDPICMRPHLPSADHTGYHLPGRRHRKAVAVATKIQNAFRRHLAASAFRRHLAARRMKTERHIKLENAIGPKMIIHIFSQGEILAGWILAAKLPNSNSNFAGDFWVDFSPVFSKEKDRKNSTKKSPQNSPRSCSEKFPSDFRRSLFLNFYYFGVNFPLHRTSVIRGFLAGILWCNSASS